MFQNFLKKKLKKYINRNSKLNKNTYNLKWNILCTMDIDALEITKINSIRKYEENAYLLGNIFSINKRKTTTTINYLGF